MTKKTPIKKVRKGTIQTKTFRFTQPFNEPVSRMPNEVDSEINDFCKKERITTDRFLSLAHTIADPERTQGFVQIYVLTYV